MPLAPLVLLVQVQVEGLRAHEQLVRLAPVTRPAEEAEARYVHARGRVVDAFTGLPIAGATIESWSEEITEATGGFRRFGEATSRASGQYTVRVREGGLSAEKARVRAPGYATLSTVAGDLESTQELFPLGPESPRVRFVDALGRPILNARITSTRTCAHDLPAFTLFPDAAGVFTLTEFAYQDELPDLRFHAPGYLGVKYLDSDELLLPAPAADGVHQIAVPRALHPRVRLLDENGAPRKNELLRLLDAGNHLIARTDQFGAVHLPSRYSPYGISMHRLEEGTPYLGEIPSWMAHADEGFALRGDDDGWEESRETGTIRINLPDDLPEGLRPGFELVHARHGWLGSVSARSEPPWTSAFPAGEVCVGWGGAFEEIQPGFARVEIEAGATTTLEPELRFASWVEFERPEGVRSIWFEVGPPDGPGAHGLRLDYDDDEVRVPLHTPWRVGFRYDGASHVHELPPVEGATTLDLAGLLPVEASTPLLGSVELVLPEGVEPEAAECWPSRVADWNEDLPAPVRTERGWRVQGPAERPMLVSIRVPGHVGRWARVTPSVPTQGPHELGLTPACALELALADGWRRVRGITSSDSLPAGLHELVLEDPDGARWGLVLHLRAGESRTIRIGAN